jgi:hypothetical protein
MEQKKLFRRLHLSISSTYKISFSVSKRGGIVQLRPTLPISFLPRDQNNLGSDIPTKTITIRDRDKPWFNSGIKRVMKIRDSLHKKCANSRILITYANIRFKGIKLIT